MHLMPAAMARGLAGTAIGLALLSGAASAQDASAAPAENQIADFTLDNGLEVVVIPDRRAPVVTHMLWFKVGSADEEPGKSGIAHFLEHLMFKGTDEHPQGEFSARIAEVGGRENAFTSYDYTAYFQQIAPEHLETMMEFEADRMTGLVLTDAVVDPERQVVIEERNSRIETQPNSILGESVNATLYQNHGYGVPIIGWMHEIEKLNRADALEFYQRYYAPNNAVLVVAGDVDVDEVRELAARATEIAGNVRAIVAPFIPSSSVALFSGLGIAALRVDAAGAKGLKGQRTIALPEVSKWSEKGPTVVTLGSQKVPLTWLALGSERAWASAGTARPTASRSKA